jgi:dihydroflavonol-4-reductase
MARVLVTGASGFVGAAVMRAALRQGDAVRVIVRAESPRENLLGLNVDPFIGNLLDPTPVGRAMQGVDCLYHVAADYRIWAPDVGEITRNNLEMTRVVMDAALKTGVTRIVYTSSVATLRPHDDTTPSDESRPYKPGEAAGVYKNSKVLAERLVEQYVAERGLPAVIVNPSTPIGPGDVKPTPTGKVVLEAARGRIPAFVDTGVNIVHVDDCAAGHLGAAAHGIVGERYVLGGQNVPLRVMLADIARIVGRKPPRISLPRRALFPGAYVSEFVAGLTKREPIFTVDALRMAKYHMYFSSAKAEKALGYTARPYVEALADAITWFRESGRLN